MSDDTAAAWLLRGKESIRSFLGNPSDHMLRKWIDAGMPVWIESGEWTAHKGNLEEFFRAYTRRRAVIEEPLQQKGRNGKRT